MSMGIEAHISYLSEQSGDFLFRIHANRYDVSGGQPSHQVFCFRLNAVCEKAPYPDLLVVGVSMQEDVQSRKPQHVQSEVFLAQPGPQAGGEGLIECMPNGF